MKKKLYLLTISLLFITAAQAQVRKSNRMFGYFGVKAGVTLSNMSNDMAFDPEFSTGTGFQIGGVYNMRWGQRTASSLPGTGWWGLQPELIYSYQAIKSSSGDIKLNYIKAPIMLKVYPLAELSLEIGPEFSYLLSTGSESIEFNDATVILSDCKGFDWGLGVGVAYEFDFGLMVGTRYSFSTQDLGKNLKWKNNCNLQFTAGWLF